MAVFGPAMTCGLLLALSSAMLSTRFGIGLEATWQDVVASNAAGLRSALAWWAIAGAGFAGSFVTGLIVNSALAGAQPARWLPWLGGLFFLALVSVPYLSSAAAMPGPLMGFAAQATAFGLGAATAFCGSWLALPK